MAVYVEPIAIADVYASGLATVEWVSASDLRFTFYVNQTSPSGEPERAIVERIVLADVAAREAARTALAAIGAVLMRNCVECLKHGMH